MKDTKLGCHIQIRCKEGLIGEVKKDEENRILALEVSDHPKPSWSAPESADEVPILGWGFHLNCRLFRARLKIYDIDIWIKNEIQKNK